MFKLAKSIEVRASVIKSGHGDLAMAAKPRHPGAQLGKSDQDLLS